MIILILSCENTKDVVIYVYIMGCCVHCFRSFFSLRKVIWCYVPKSPQLRKIKAEFWVISQFTQQKVKKDKILFVFLSIMYKFAGRYKSVTYEVTKLYSIDYQPQFVYLLYLLFLKYIIYYYLIGFLDFIIVELLQVTFRSRN